jgi:hypothetical protein
VGDQFFVDSYIYDKNRYLRVLQAGIKKLQLNLSSNGMTTSKFSDRNSFRFNSLLTTEQGPSGESNSPTYTHEIPSVSWYPRVRYCVM